MIAAFAAARSRITLQSPGVLPALMALPRKELADMIERFAPEALRAGMDANTPAAGESAALDQDRAAFWADWCAFCNAVPKSKDVRSPKDIYDEENYKIW